ncbi:MAG: hypothetical protein ACI4A5_01625 [Hominilimicola sp.]
MDKKCEDFCKKNGISFEDIMYIDRMGKKGAIHLLGGRTVMTYISSKTLVNAITDFTGEAPINVNKGIYLYERYIAKVENGNYIMTDGAVFKGRVRTPGEHKKNAQKVLQATLHTPYIYPQNIRERFSCVDDMPIAFCIIELVFNEDGRGIDFIFRYCNKEMAVIEGVPVEEMIDKSFYEVFDNGDKKWLVTYADVALNGGQREIRSFSPEIGKYLCIRCFQPEEGYCACILTEEEK